MLISSSYRCYQPLSYNTGTCHWLLYHATTSPPIWFSKSINSQGDFNFYCLSSVIINDYLIVFSQPGLSSCSTRSLISQTFVVHNFTAIVPNHFVGSTTATYSYWKRDILHLHPPKGEHRSLWGWDGRDVRMWVGLVQQSLKKWTLRKKV